MTPAGNATNQLKSLSANRMGVLLDGRQTSANLAAEIINTTRRLLTRITPFYPLLEFNIQQSDACSVRIYASQKTSIWYSVKEDDHSRPMHSIIMRCINMPIDPSRPTRVT